MASGENVLWVVEQTKLEGGITGQVVKRRFVFRTRTAARKFAIERNAKSAWDVVYYTAPMRATWGPAS